MSQTQWMSLTFLGTSSGGGPSDARNCSSIVLDVVGDGSLWMVDCAEGTIRQFSFQPSLPNQRSVKAFKINSIFITHMHADHVMGIPTLLRNILGMHHPDSPTDKVLKVNIYGPAGLRTMLRIIFTLTHTRTAEAYAVHELLFPGDPVTPCEPPNVRHSSEAPGRDIMCDEDGFWRNIASGHSPRGEVIVQAGPILHRDPCIGYIFHEPPNEPPFPEPRKIVVLGDTSSAAALTPLISSTPGRVSLLVHESTDAYIPSNVDASLAARRSPELVKQKCLERGHSTPLQAGQCAGQWDAERLVLNHIGSRFPAPTLTDPRSKKYRTAIMREIERQATEAWHATPSVLPSYGEEAPEQIQQRQAIAASDFLSVHIPARGTEPPSEHKGRRDDNSRRGSNWDKRRRMNR